MTTLNPKTAMLSALYLIILLVLGLFINLGIGWILDNWVIPLINWFNHLAFVWKFLLFIFGGYAIFFIILNAVKIVTSIITGFVFYKLPENNFTIISSTIIYLVNLVWLIYGLWEMTPTFTIWIFLEFILLIFFIASATSVLMPWYLKAKITRRERYS